MIQVTDSGFVSLYLLVSRKQKEESEQLQSRLQQQDAKAQDTIVR